MKKRQMLLACILALVLSVTGVLAACSSENKGAAKENKSSAGQIVGVWEAYDIYDPKQGTMAEEGYSKISEQFQAIYAFNFAEDGTGTFIRFGVQKPFTWAADGDGKITVTLEGTAGTFTGSINTSTGRLRLKGSDETDAELKQVSKTAGDYSSVAYEPFDQLTNKGTIPHTSTFNDLKEKKFEITREVNKTLIDTEKLHMSLYAVAQVPGTSQEGYVFEIVNKYSDVLYTEFWLGDITGPLNASGNTFVEPGEKFYFFIPNVSKTPGSLVGISNPKAILTTAYNSAKDGTVTEQKQKTELDLNIPPKSE